VAAGLGVPLLDWVLVEDGSAVVAAPRDPEVVSPADSLLPPQLGLLEVELLEGREADVDVGLLDQPPLLLLLLLLLNDLEPPLLPLRLPPLDPRASTSLHKESTKTRATIRVRMVGANLHNFPRMTSS
jgi:hypothetical protein